MKTTTEILLGLILLVLSVFLIVNYATPASVAPVSETKIVETAVPVFSGGDVALIGDAVYATTVDIDDTNVNATDTVAFTSNPSIAYRRIQNIGGTMITCQLDSATPTLVSLEGIVLSTTTYGDNMIWEERFGYWGEIRCIADSGTGTISVIQY